METQQSSSDSRKSVLRDRIDDAFPQRVYIEVGFDGTGKDCLLYRSHAAWLPDRACAPGSTVDELINPKDLQILQEAIYRARRGSSEIRTVQLLRTPGDPIYAEIGLTAGQGTERVFGYMEPLDTPKRLRNDPWLPQLLEMSNVSYTLLRRDLTIVDFNDRSSRYAEAVFGKPLRQGASLLEYTTPDSRERLEKNVVRVLEGERVRSVWSNEVGSHRYHFSFVYVPIPDAGRAINYFAMTTIDWTELRRSEYENQQLLTAVSQSPISIVMTNPDGTITYVNPFFEKLTGYAAEEVLGRTPRMFQSGQTPEATYVSLWETVLAGKVWSGEMVNRKRDGSSYRERAILAPVRNEAGEILSIIGLKVDVTRETEALEQLKEKEIRFRRLVESSPVGIGFADPRGRLVEANDALVRILGAPDRESLLGRDLLRSAPFVEHGLSEKFVECMKGNQPLDIQQEYRSSFGKELYIRIYANPVRDDDGKIYGLQAIVEDITERRENERRLARSLKEKETLLQELHHRVKNNLQSVASLIRLQTEAVKDDDDRELFQKNVHRIRSMAMVHQLLYRSPDLYTIDLGVYLEQLTAYLRGSQESTGATIAVQSGPDPIALHIERAVPLGLMVNEIISNSLKHLSSEPGDLWVQVRLAREGPLVRLEIRDSGPADARLIVAEGQDGGYGTRLIFLLAEQTGAEITAHPGPGAHFTIAFDPSVNSEAE